MGQSVFPAPSSTSLYSRSALVTSSGTWAHPDGYGSTRVVKVVIHGGGGGGGSGSVGASTGSSNWAFQGGAGGGAGYVVVCENYAMTADATIVIGAGGTAGAALTNSGSANGNSGTTGGATSFDNLTANGGGGGPGGQQYTSGERGYSGASGGNVSGSLRVDATSFPSGDGYRGYASPGTYGSGQTNYTANVGLVAMTGMTGTTFDSSNITTYPREQFHPWSGYLSGAGGHGASGQNTATVSPTSTSVGSPGGIGVYLGGNGGAYHHTVTNVATAGTSGTAGGLGAGGGGGGAASSTTATTATSGAGGAGGSGYVRIFY